jgi:small subunit ribosomal protein S16
MAVRIRLRRTGAKKQPSYRVVAADSRAPRDGKFIEVLGWYNPRTDPPTVQVREERVLHWLKQGARPTETVQELLGRAGVWAKWRPSEENK